MRKALLVAFIMLPLYVCAQDPYRYYYNDSSEEGGAGEITLDEELFFIPLYGEGDIFTLLSRYNFSWIKYRRRGYETGHDRAMLGNTQLYGLVSPMPDYQIISALGRSSAGRITFPGLEMGERAIGGVAGVDEYTAEVGSLFREGLSISLSGHNRKGVAGLRFSQGMNIGRSDVGISFAGRWGDDMAVDGVSTNENTLLAGHQYQINDRHSFSYLLAFSFAQNTLRSYTVNEVYELTGNRLYNPSWGYYGGDRVSANTFDRLGALLLIDYSGQVTERTLITASLSFRAGADKRGGLSWFDAQNPYPDYYRYLPSYDSANPAQGWLANDARVTQIFWEQMVEQNLGREHEQAAYVFDKRVENIGYVQAGIRAKTTFDEGFTLTCGVDLHHDSRLRYKELADMLHADVVYDIDQYLLDDDLFGQMHLNNLREPGRLLRRGDRFGYNYNLSVSRISALAMLNYRAGRLRIDAGIEFGTSTLQRNGLYEKEIFPGNGSYGRSGKLRFDPYTFKAALGYSLSARHFLSADIMASAAAPYAGTIFLNPNYNNTVAGNPEMTGCVAGEVQYSAIMPRLNIQMALYGTKTSSESAVYRYWDDISSVYSDMLVSDVAKLYYGAELSGMWTISPRFAVSFAACAGSSAYDSNPQITIVDDATHGTVVANAKSYLKGYRLATAPEYAFTGELKYSSWGWLGTLTASYAGGRYVDITPLRRMERAYGLAGSGEMRAGFVDQERLDDAFTLDLFLLRSFSLRKGTLTLIGSVKNLLGTTDTVYNGYEQMRVMKRGSAPNFNWQPSPAKYLYSYGRTFYVSLSYSF